MNKLIAYILIALALTVQVAVADAPVIWNGTTAKWLPSGLHSAGLCSLSASGVMTSRTLVSGDIPNNSADTLGNAATATALAANPTDCASNTFANAIAASGNLTCASIPNAATTATASAGNSTIVARDGSGNFAAGTITAALTGNASTASALAANPTDCSANNYATSIDAGGNLTCGTVTDSGLATSYLKADGSRGLSGNWNAGSVSITATTFVGALTGNASTATNLTGTPALPNGTTATTQSANDNSTNLATTAYADLKLPKAGGTMTGLLTVKEVKETVVAGGTCSTSYSVDPTAGSVVTLTLNGACAIGVSNLAAGHSFTIYLTQSSTTAPTFTSAYKWATGTVPTFSTSATKFDNIYCGSPDGTKVICGAIVDAH